MALAGVLAVGAARAARPEPVVTAESVADGDAADEETVDGGVSDLVPVSSDDVPISEAYRACLADNGFDLTAWPQRGQAGEPAAVLEPSVEQIAAAVGATRACRDEEPVSKQRVVWHRCLDEHGVVESEFVPILPRPTSAQDRLRAGTAHAVCKYFLPRSPPLDAYVRCAFDAGFPQPIQQGGEIVPAELARAAGDACVDVIRDAQGDYANCMSDHGIHLNLPGAVAWSSQAEQQAHEACRAAAGDREAMVEAWYRCLIDNGAKLALPNSTATAGDPEPPATPVEVARRAMAACASLNLNAFEIQRAQSEPIRGCLERAGMVPGFPGNIEGVDLASAMATCASMALPSTRPPSSTALYDCLATRPTLLSPWEMDPAEALKALTSCEHLDPDAVD